ncbi:conserved hypothetical protein [Alteracholeplasma palmae J233]|uniref:Uncharacterized protein n=1 Tax=Alteracholeplasma palmae (strain ATCC 49389 / J233) TaxID=1318466 RepID=U4KLU0_ALTPJ|nr:hypothetical protein [Alteracholeplasma palmae]CCV64959.1 conserved hypothetical protein [Alteracholeplasma palmae J233]
MLFKLIKHELKSSYRNYVPIFVAVLIATGFVALSISNESINGIGLSFMIAMGLVFSLFILMFVNISKSLGDRMFGKPGYLLFTVPASTKDVVLSRIIANFLWVLASTIISMLPIAVFILMIQGIANKQEGGASFDAFEILLAVLGITKEANFLDIMVAVIEKMMTFLHLIAAMFVAFTVSHTAYRGDKKKLVQIVIFIVLVTAVNLFLGSSLFKPSQTATGQILVSTTLQKGYAIIFGVLYTSAAFFGSGYLIDKKLELQ